MTDYSSYTQQDFQVTDLAGGSVWTHGLVNAGGSGTLSNPFKWQAALSSTGGGQFTLHYWRSGSTNNWGHAQRTDITSTVSGGVVTVAFSGSNIFTFNESDAFVSSGGGTGTEDVVTIDDAAGNLSNNPSFSEMDVSISALSPGGSDFSYRLMKDNVLVDSRTTHVHDTISNYEIDYSSVGQYGVWDLVAMQLSTLTIKHMRRLTLVDPSAKKKVFCNFW